MKNINIEKYIEDLPDKSGVRRFFEKLSQDSPSETKKLEKNQGLLSDVLTISAFSPHLATTILQNPKYISWLKRQRISSNVREKEELLESLARFALTNSQTEPGVMLSRFRRRELIRIYLKDIRGLGTIAEITGEISNLADAILEYALQISRQELDNRYGIPLEVNTKNKASRAKFCIVALGKLGSKELNYSSDIDLLFIYSNNGTTSGQGTRDATTNREYFIKLANFVTKTIGRQIGEGAAYRVDLRLRPHGRVGSLAISVNEAVNYYKNSARMWERQVLIRSRASAGDAEVFQEFIENVSANVFSVEETVENALENVRRSKQKIDLEKISKNGFDVKLGKGGIREIEFIAQALQLAYGGKDRWLRSPHTLISLSRLADRKLLTESELTQLFEAYDFLRRLEHRLQMENGLQTHLLPDNSGKRELISKRMRLNSVAEFNAEFEKHTKNVNRIFAQIFGQDYINTKLTETDETYDFDKNRSNEKDLEPLLASIDKSEEENKIYDEKFTTLTLLSEISPPFSEMLTANPQFVKNLPDSETVFVERNYFDLLSVVIEKEETFARKLAVLRKVWSRSILEIATNEIFENIDYLKSKDLQTKLAEASINIAVLITKEKLESHFETGIKDFSFAVLGLGKLGSGGMDYGSDLDLILIYDDKKSTPPKNLSNAEFYAKAAEIFVNVLSGLTRDGSLYRVDLRLRPDGKNGATTIGKNALLNYLKTRSAIWEWLAYVKIRGVAGDLNLAKSAEFEARNIIHKNAQMSEIAESDYKKLKDETRQIRQKLEKAKSTSRKGKEIDIKFGEGGLQDVYFTVRYLQLRDNLPDDGENRSTVYTLKKLHENKSLSAVDFENLLNGYKFISELDHNLRLTVGRSTSLPIANRKAMQIISKRMNLPSTNDLLEKLTFHRINIRSSFENILQN